MIAAIPILFEDEILLVVDKPAGVLVHPSVREREGTLKCALLAGREGIFFPHRLDRDTSGLMVIAKDNLTARDLGFQFARRQVEKHYTALVAGNVELDEMTIDAPLGRDAADKPQWRVRAEGKPAQSILRVVERRGGTTLLDLIPITGRTNQLRAHCAHVGHPIVGDVWFHGTEAPRLMLHASRLSFRHPATSDVMAYESTMPLVE